MTVNSRLEAAARAICRAYCRHKAGWRDLTPVQQDFEVDSQWDFWVVEASAALMAADLEDPKPSESGELLIEIARAIAEGLGLDFDHAPEEHDTYGPSFTKQDFMDAAAAAATRVLYLKPTAPKDMKS